LLHTKNIQKEKLWKVLSFLQQEKKIIIDAMGNIKQAE